MSSAIGGSLERHRTRVWTERRDSRIVQPVPLEDFLDPDLAELVREAEGEREQVHARFAHTPEYHPADRLYPILANFEANLTRSLAEREQARRHGALRDDGHDREALAMEAAVIDLCKQIIDAENRIPLGANIAGQRLAAGLTSVRLERDRAISSGWAYRRERKMLALREVQWEKSVRHARRRRAL